MNCYAIINYKGDKISQNKEEAALYYKISADKGYAHSIHLYADMNFDILSLQLMEVMLIRWIIIFLLYHFVE